MATYYWLGAVSGNVNDRYNWTLYNPGFTGPTAANTRPPAGSNVIFSKFQGVCGYAGITNLPSYGPCGFFYGATSSGTTAQYVVDFTVTPQFDKTMGSTGTYLSFFAKTININRGVTSSTLYNYLNVYDSPGASYSAANATLKVDARNQSSTIKTFNYVKGTLASALIGYVPGVSNGSNNYFYDCTIENSIQESSWNGVANNNIVISPSTTLTATNINLNGNSTSLIVERGTSVLDGTITCNNIGSVDFPPFGASGPSGADNALARTYILQMVLNGTPSKPTVDIRHGADIYKFFIQGGDVRFSAFNDPTIIRGGILNASNAKISSNYDDSVTILDSSQYADGFILYTPSQTHTHQPISLRGKYNLRLNNPIGYTAI
jgi:hypothetical protein